MSKIRTANQIVIEKINYYTYDVLMVAERIQIEEAINTARRELLEYIADHVKVITKMTGCGQWCGSDGCSPRCANEFEEYVIDKESILKLKSELK